MQTKFFVGYLLDHALKEELAPSEHTLTITIKEGKEYIGLRTKETIPSLATIYTLKEEVMQQLTPLCTTLLLESNQIMIFPEYLLG